MQFFPRNAPVGKYTKDASNYMKKMGEKYKTYPDESIFMVHIESRNRKSRSLFNETNRCLHSDLMQTPPPKINKQIRT
jgi:hypothetical protein